MVKRCIEYIYWFVKSWLYYPKLRKMRFGFIFKSRFQYAKYRAKIGNNPQKILRDEPIVINSEWTCQFNEIPIENDK